MTVPTIRDVARLAGVSHMTVSRVINGETGVRPQKRALVEDAIRQLNFSRNPVARALSGAAHVRIALLHRFPNAGHLGDFLVHLLEETTRAHASLLVRKVVSDDEIEEIVRELVGAGVRAVILTPPLADDEQLVDLLARADIAAVVAGSTRLNGRLSVIGIDERAAARAMTEHLLAIGHRRIGLIKGHPRHAASQARLEGFLDGIEAAGLKPDPALIVQGRFDYLSGLDASEQLLGLPDRPTAIFASNDDMAAATIAVAHRQGIDVPADLTVCGFDDSTLATTIWPALTTIRLPIEEMTRSAVEIVLRERTARNGSELDRKQHVVLDHVLVRRQSDGPPRRRPRVTV